MLAVAAAGQSVYTPYQIATYSGATAVGSADGSGNTARFFDPMDVAVDASGNLYVADTDNDTLRKIAPNGTVATFAGVAGSAGAADGTGGAARFNLPLGLAVDAGGNVYVADTGNAAIRKVTPAADVTTVPLGTALESPRGVAVDAGGDLYITDGTLVRKVTPDGAVATLASGFVWAWGVVLDAQGNLYVTDYGSGKVSKISAEGAVTTVASGLDYPVGIAVDAAGNLYVSCSANGGMDLGQGSNTIERISPGGVATVLAGSGGVIGSADGTGVAAQFGDARGIALDGAGDIFIADEGNSAIREIGPGAGVTTFAGLINANGSQDGAGASARFWYPSSVATDLLGNCYVVDARNNTIRKIAPGGVVTTLAGMAGASGSADGTGSAARFQFSYTWYYGVGDETTIYGGGVACDSAGNVYVADSGNDTIRKISPSGAVTTLAGTAKAAGKGDGVGGAASFDAPTGIAVDSSGNVYVADAGNLEIRMITPAGAVTTLAVADYLYQYVLYPQAISAPPVVGVAVDRSGDVYFADGSTVREINATGVISLFAGSPGTSGSADGPGSSASFSGSGQMAFDPAGNLFVVDSGNNAIRRITPAGVVTTVAGLPGAGRSAADGTGSAARFWQPLGVAVDSAGTLYIADAGNNEIRTGTAAVAPPVIVTQPQSASVVAGGSFTLSVVAVATGGLSYQWYQGNTALAGQTNASYTKAGAQMADAGAYSVVVTSSGGSTTSSAATVTVTQPAPSGGGGGGGAPSEFFLAAVLVACCLRLRLHQPAIASSRLR